MNNQTINDIYETNNEIREKTKQLVADLTDEQTAFLPESEKWTIAHIIEHIAIVQDGMAKISTKLLTQAQAAGKTADGAARLSENFVQKAAEAKTLKFQAPDRVHPSGNQTIEESLKKMDETREKLEELRPLFESVECSDFKFPHPFMGELTAHEWLTLVGGHEARHLRQIENMLEKSASI
ncbi:MAG TPA: DinB family protein [Pyrinomonadaceae bacterium]|nr:DinB family protein [Pyrinomonadaceae bacterium]